LIPVVTFIGADIGALLGGAIVTESVFNLPGIGREVYDAVRQQEGGVVVGIFPLMVFFFIFFNLIVDVLYAVLDPRIRYDSAAGAGEEPRSCPGRGRSAEGPGG